jgi:hypothetical protein
MLTPSTKPYRVRLAMVPAILPPLLHAQRVAVALVVGLLVITNLGMYEPESAILKPPSSLISQDLLIYSTHLPSSTLYHSGLPLLIMMISSRCMSLLPYLRITLS